MPPDWTQERKDEVIASYLAQNPTPETSTEIVKSIADDLGDDFTPNGVMAILIKAGKYVKKTQGTAAKANGESKSTRVNKAEAIQGLVDVIEANGVEADGDIIGKLTGKAAIYFKETIETIANNAE